MASIEDRVADLERENERLRAELAQQKRVDAKLQQSGQHHHWMFSGAAEGILVVETESKKFRYANPAICQMLGYAEDELLRMSVVDIHPPEEHKRILTTFTALASGEKTLVASIPCVRKDGTILYADIASTGAVLDGTPCIIGFFIDVTERRRAEEALSNVVASARCILWDADVQLGGDWRMRIHASDLTRRDFGLEELAGDAVGEKWASHISPQQREKMNRTCAEALQSGAPGYQQEFIFCDSEGKERWLREDVKITPIRPGLFHLVGVCVDITEHRRTEEALREGEERFRRLFEDGPLAMAFAASDFHFMAANPAFCRLLGYTEQELRSLTFKDITHPEHLATDTKYATALRRGEASIYQTEKRYLRKDKESVWCAVTVAPVRNAKGEFLYFIAMIKDITAHKQAVQALEEEHGFNTAIIESAANGICVCRDIPDHPHVAFTVWNQRMTEITGYTMEEINQLGWYQSLYPDPELQAKARARMDRMRQGENMHGEEWQATRKDGTKRVFSISTSIVRKGPHDVHVLGLIQDVTERRGAEDGLKQSVSLLRATLDATADGILVVDSSGKISGYNDRFRLMWRIPETVLTSRSDQQALDFVLAQLKYPEQFIAKVRQLYVDTEAESFDTLEFKDGRTFERYSRPQRLDGRPVGRVWSFRDVTERKRAEEDRKRLFTLSLDMLCVAGFDGHMRQVNPAWVKALGWSEEELLSRPWIDFVHPEDHAATIVAGEQLIAGKPVLGFENRYRCKNGSYRRLSWNSFPLSEENLIFAVVRDMTEFRRMEERLRQSEKMEAIGQLAGGVAHDFNNQLAGILGFAELLRLRLRDEESRQCADSIIRASMRSADLTRQLLAFARKGKYLSVAVDVHAIVGEVAALLGRSADKRITIRQVLAADAPMTIGDPTQLQNALLNLAINGCDAMPNGGELVLATEVVALSKEYCRSIPFEIAPGRCIQVSVTDSGEGMSEEVKRHLFEPFFTTKQLGKGTGMGLAAVYGIVRNHKGAISVYSELGRGSTFKVYLPLQESAATMPMPMAERIPDTGTFALAPARILVVDDEEVILKFAAMALQGLGYQVTTCKDGAEAVAHYRAAWQETDLVILDMVMPGQGGGEAFAAMRQINPKVRAILTSGYSINGQAQSILDQGVLGFVQKPFRLEELTQKVAEALQAPKP